MAVNQLSSHQQVGLILALGVVGGGGGETPPLKGNTVLAIDPGFKNGCKSAVISPTGWYDPGTGSCGWLRGETPHL